MSPHSTITMQSCTLTAGNIHFSKHCHFLICLLVSSGNAYTFKYIQQGPMNKHTPNLTDWQLCFHGNILKGHPSAVCWSCEDHLQIHATSGPLKYTSY